MGTTEGIGEKRFLLFEIILESGFDKWTRNLFQRGYHDLVTSALSKILLEDDYLRIEKSIIEYKKWPIYHQRDIYMAPRLSGKSTAVAMLIAALAESIQTYPLKKPYRISVFSPSGRINEEMVKYVIFFLTIRGCQFHKTQKYNVKIEIKTKEDNLTVVIDFYPANPKYLRGVNPDLIIVDEAAYMDINFFKDIILPILGIENKILSMVSSPNSDRKLFCHI